MACKHSKLTTAYCPDCGELNVYADPFSQMLAHCTVNLKRLINSIENLKEDKKFVKDDPRALSTINKKIKRLEKSQEKWIVWINALQGVIKKRKLEDSDKR